MFFVCDLYFSCFVFIYPLDSWIHVCVINYFTEQPKPEDLCNPSPCGPNADCREGICTCLPNYFGDPYSYCRPECTMNSDCSRVKACVNQFCVDPCIGTCGTNAKCDVVNHIPMCSCFPGTTGDPFTLCRPQISEGMYNIHMSFSLVYIWICINNPQKYMRTILKKFWSISQNQENNHAHRLPVGRTAFARWWTIMQSVLVRLTLSVVLLRADQSV